MIFTNDLNNNVIDYKKQHANDPIFEKLKSRYYILTPLLFINNKISSDIKEIEEYAFYKCTGLKTICLPNSIQNIKDYAFYGCLNLENKHFEVKEIFSSILNRSIRYNDTSWGS